MGNKLGRKKQVVEKRYTKPQQSLYMNKDVDFKKFMQKRLESSSSSTSAVTADTEYGSAAEDEEIVSSPSIASYPQVNRDGEFDFDLEDIMVMEAIWLSIQETGIQRDTSRSHDENSEENHYLEPSTPCSSSSSPSGGLACAIAVLAERQQMNGESSSNQNVNVSSHNMVSGNCNYSHHNAMEQDSSRYLQGVGISYTRSDMSDDSADRQ